MIDADEPTSWQDLQDRVSRILREAGVETAVEKVIQTARGSVSIDVWASDPAATPAQTYLIECKRWRTRVPQTVVHAFRAVVGDAGANWGAIVSAAGFQRGAYKAAEYSNVRLLSWDEFQALFAERWFSNHFVRKFEEATNTLMEYTEPINSRISKKADLLRENQRLEFKRLRETHLALKSFCDLFQGHVIEPSQKVFGEETPRSMPSLPLRNALGISIRDIGMSVADDILDADSFRSLLESVCREASVAIAQFDEVFGERA